MRPTLQEEASQKLTETPTCAHCVRRIVYQKRHDRTTRQKTRLANGLRTLEERSRTGLATDIATAIGRLLVGGCHPFGKYPDSARMMAFPRVPLCNLHFAPTAAIKLLDKSDEMEKMKGCSTQG
jgi:hypothetical protein